MPIYLDHNATTPTDPAVFEAITPYFETLFGNASSNSHPFGWDAAAAVKTGRKQVAEALGCDAKNIVFTSGATESNNIALFGAIRKEICVGKTPHLITSNIEHGAVLEVAHLLKDLGAEVTFLPVDKFGQISVNQVHDAIKENTRLISIMAANNEIGSINPIESIGALAKKMGLLFHCDAAQALGKYPIDVNELSIDLLSLSGHKIYAPKGIGALYVRDPYQLEKVMGGGQQELGLRPGTLNVPGIVGLGKACQLSVEKMEGENHRLTKLRDHLIDTVLEKCPEAILNGHRTERLPNNVSFSFEGLSADKFTLGLSGIAFSSGSACCSSEAKPSYVIKALGRDDNLARATVRLGLGQSTTEQDIETVITKICHMVAKNRKATNLTNKGVNHG